MAADRNALADEIEQADVDAAMRTFERLAGDRLRYPEQQKWHLRDKLAMREVLKEYGARLAALRQDAGAAMRETATGALGSKPHPAWYVLAKMSLAIANGRGIRLRHDELQLLQDSAIGPLMNAAKEYGTSTGDARPDPILLQGATITPPAIRALPLSVSEERRDGE